MKQTIFESVLKLSVLLKLYLIWFGVIIIAALYCLMHGLFISENYDFNLGIVTRWLLVHWGAWPFILPLIFKWLENIYERQSPVVNGLFIIVGGTFLSGVFSLTVVNLFMDPWGIAEGFYHLTPINAAMVSIYSSFYVIFKVITPITIQLGEQSDGFVLKTLSVSKGDLKVNLSMDEIDYFQSARNYVEVFVGYETYIKRDSLKNIESSINGEAFIRCHRSFLCSKKKIAGLKRHKNGGLFIMMKSGDEIPVSRAYQDTIKNLFA